MKTISIKHLTFSHKACFRGLEFYKMEIQFLQQRLDEIAADNTGQEAAQGIEHFQNQLIIHNQQIDQLKHRVQINMDQLAQQLKLSVNFIPETINDEAEQIAADYEQEERLFKEMHQDFNRFAALWM